MTSILKADTIQDTDGNNIINENSNTITIGASGDTTNIIGTLQNNGAAVGGTNTPYFYLYGNFTNTQDNVFEKCTLTTERFDTAGIADASNSKVVFTAATAGKYNMSYGAIVNMANYSSELQTYRLSLYKNGSGFYQAKMSGGSSLQEGNYLSPSFIVDAADGDYFEIYVLTNVSSSNRCTVDTFFSGFKIIE
tara:strand:+ start:495 stop:1073 length:579 start_codon:yes stop_codon:yes gene_type:complete